MQRQISVKDLSKVLLLIGIKILIQNTKNVLQESEDLLPVDENIIHISIPYEWEGFSSLDDESEEYKLIKYQNLLTRIWNYINRLRDKGFDYRDSYTEDGFVLFDLVVDNIYTEQEKQLFKEVTGTLDSKLKKEPDDKYKTMY